MKGFILCGCVYTGETLAFHFFEFLAVVLLR